MLRVINLRVNVENKHSLKEILERKYPRLHKRIQAIYLVRKAVDARRKPQITFVYTLLLEVEKEKALAKWVDKEKNISYFSPQEPEAVKIGNQLLAHRPVVVGFGPAGMLAALYLAREGYQPLVLERGQDVDTRTSDVEAFWRTG